MKHRSTLLRSLTVFAALAAGTLLASSPVTGAETKGNEGPFHSLKFAEAQQKAQAEGKLVFVDVWASWCGPCRMLDATTWKDGSVVDLLKQHTVAIKVNADENSKFATDHDIEALPTLLVFRPDGTEVTRLVGYVDAKGFQAKLGATLAADKI